MESYVAVMPVRTESPGPLEALATTRTAAEPGASVADAGAHRSPKSSRLDDTFAIDWSALND